MVFATRHGVICETDCASFTTLLTASEKLKSLELASCHASFEEDKTRILRLIESTFLAESAENRIKKLMGNTMRKSMQQLEYVTAGLLRQLGHGHRHEEVLMTETF